ncbi:MAG: hypothetical protein JOY95_12870 [Silvibacterium sp.]|nr:hypothetical protein [Silvibacterium sp.]
MTHVPVIDLDLLHWEDNRYHISREEESAKRLVRDAAAGPRWIIEGVYGWLAGVALPKASALSYPNKRFRGRVQGVGWALYQNNGAIIQGLAQVEEMLNWVRLSQRFPARVVLEERDPRSRSGMGAIAIVTIRGER